MAVRFGHRVRDVAGVETFGPDDFTLSTLAKFTLPAQSGSGSGVLTAPSFVYDVPGYDPAKCFVVITPLAYAGYPQPGWPDSWPMLPTYKDLGGTQIGIYCYVNRREPTGIGNDTLDKWYVKTVNCNIEIVRFG